MSELVVEILEDFLGNHKKHYQDKGQISFDCPECAMEKGMMGGDGMETEVYTTNSGELKDLAKEFNIYIALICHYPGIVSLHWL